MSRYDCVIVGSGIAGLYTALLAKEQGSVLLITKGKIDDCNTKFAQGGIAAAIGKNDSPQLHFQDTITTGSGLCDEGMVRILVDEAAGRIADLVNFGVPFDTLDGEVDLTLESAHSVPRILHAGGDATGEHIEVTLSERVRSSGIQVLENHLATEIVVEKGEVRGVKALDYYTGSTEDFECRYLILATGGAGQLFKLTTNYEIATGDGIALAFKAGAELGDMEFFQFHPTVLHLSGVIPFLISEAVRGEGGILRNADGKRFMPEYAPQAELAPRDVVARSIVYEMKKTGENNVFLDATHLPPHIITTRFPQIYRFCLEHGVDIIRELVPVAPAAHYMIGGVKVNSWGETNLVGLFAAGEVACTGVHGANRLASNSLLEVLVFSKRIIEKMRKMDKPTTAGSQRVEIQHLLKQRQPTRVVAPPSLSALKQLFWDEVGIIRSRGGLAKTADTLAAWQESLPLPTDRPSYELDNLVLTGRLIAEAALLRQESRGAHFRSDFPQSLPEWQSHIIFTAE
jgi:L-aspartate oxidase|tara:strand:- start:723 stop:2264 length:1542 start_codon:yes stop_codon:yes gene_type:complete